MKQGAIESVKSTLHLKPCAARKGDPRLLDRLAATTVAYLVAGYAVGLRAFRRLLIVGFDI